MCCAGALEDGSRRGGGTSTPPLMRGGGVVVRSRLAAGRRGGGGWWHVPPPLKRGGGGGGGRHPRKAQAADARLRRTIGIRRHMHESSRRIFSLIRADMISDKRTQLPTALSGLPPRVFRPAEAKPTDMHLAQ